MDGAIAEFRETMNYAGLYSNEPIIADGKLHRFKTKDDKSPNSWYVLFMEKIPTGVFGCWKRNIKQQWLYSKALDLESDYENVVTKYFSDAKKEFLNAQNKLHQKVSERAVRIWQYNSFANVNHPYLIKKNIKPYGAKSYRRLLILPLFDETGKIWSLQFINPNGDKYFLKNGKKKGLYYIIGSQDSSHFFICEGYATGCTIYEVTQGCIIVAFDSHNLLSVSKSIRNQFPDKEIIICADNDQFTEGNPGLSAGKDAAKTIDAQVIWPSFTSTNTKPTDFNDLYQLEGKEQVFAQLKINNEENNEGNFHSEDFMVNDKGVFFITHDETNEYKSPLKVCSPLNIIARTRDENGTSHGRLLKFIDPDRKCHNWAIPMEMLAGDGIEYRRILLGKGLEIASSRRARELLTHYILSSRPEKIALCVDRTGWYKNIYIFPDESIGESKEQIIFQNTNSEFFTKNSGSLGEWQQHISKYCENNSRLLFAISAAFAASILYLFDEESGGFHFVGASSIGKTTLLQIACSVWGAQERLQRWRTTNNGLEAIATLYNDSLLCLDEIGQIDSKEVGDAAYTLANGSGKGRCYRDGSIRKKNTWRTLFLSTGEIGLSDHIHQSGKKIRAGQEVRLVDIPADAEKGLGIFEDLHNFKTSAEFANYLNDAAKKYYGIAIKEFLHYITKNMNSVINFINDKKAEFIKLNVSNHADSQVYRVARRFALIAAVGELASESNLTKWRKNSAFLASAKYLDDWIKLRGGLGAKEETFALSQVKLFFELHGESRFSPWGNRVEQKTINRAGFRRKDEFFVFPEVFKQDICAGLNVRFVAQICITKGWLLPDISGKPQSSHRMPDTGNTRRVYHFCSKVFDDDN